MTPDTLTAIEMENRYERGEDSPGVLLWKIKQVIGENDTLTARVADLKQSLEKVSGELLIERGRSHKAEARLAEVERELVEEKESHDRHFSMMQSCVREKTALQCDKAELERERDAQKERADAFWSCIQEEMAENHQLYIKLGIIPQIKQAEYPSIRLVNDAIAALQREVQELTDKRDVEWRKFVALSRDEQIQTLRGKWKTAEGENQRLREAIRGAIKSLDLRSPDAAILTLEQAIANVPNEFDKERRAMSNKQALHPPAARQGEEQP